ncbi:MAG TPA: MFS transporter [Gaiellaceae bacterium]|jgi:EmrB/QacA subfamily drug resistance transporter|nr:MFS transporter [Gaiellaceae bacterium]
MSNAPTVSDLTRPTNPNLAEAPSDPHYEKRWLILATVCLAQLMLLIDATVVNVALPSAQRALDFSTANREWVVTAYVLVFGSLLPLGGRMSDLWGRKRMFVIGASGFAAASAVAGAAQSFTELIVARGAQGLFGALVAPAAIAMIVVTFTDPAERGKAFGVFGAIGAGAGALGLLLGGVLTSYVSWRWCMFVNVAFGALALVGAMTLMTNNTNPDKPRLDVLGTALATAGLFGIVFGAAKAETDGWGAGISLIPLIAGGLLLLAFLASQRRGKYPLMPLHVVRDRNRGSGLLVLFLATIAIFSMFLFLTYYFQGVLHYSAVKTGIAFLPLPLALVISASAVQGGLVTRFPSRAFMGAGLLLCTAGMFLLTRIGVDTHYYAWALGGLTLLGLGAGSATIVGLDLSSVGVAPEDVGVAGSLANVVQQIGPAIGIAVLSTVAATATTHYATGHTNIDNLAAHAAVHGYTTAFWYGTAIFAAAAVICTTLVRPGTRTGATTEPMQIEALALLEAV